MIDLETSLCEDIETFKEQERTQKVKDYQYAVDECIDTDKYYKLSDIMDIGFGRAPRGFKQRKKGYLKGSSIIKNLKKEINKIKKYEKLKSKYYDEYEEMPIASIKSLRGNIYDFIASISNYELIPEDQEKDWFNLYSYSLEFDCEEVQIKLRDFLILSNLRLSIGYLKRFRKLPDQELVAVAIDRMISVIDENGYDPSKVKFSTFMYSCFKNYFINNHRYNQVHNPELGDYIPTNNTDIIIEDEEEEKPFNKLDFEKVNKALKKLNEKDRFIVEHYYGINGCERMTLEEIGKKYSCGKERIRQLREKAIERLKYFLKC